MATSLAMIRPLRGHHTRDFGSTGFSNPSYCHPTRSNKRHTQAGVASGYIGSPSTCDPYHTLGLHLGASEHDIKKAYRRLALQFHPDVCKGETCTSKFMQINKAYEAVMGFLQGTGDAFQQYCAEPFVAEPMMGVNDDSWEDWEEWMGWEGAGTRDYSTHINDSL